MSWKSVSYLFGEHKRIHLKEDNKKYEHILEIKKLLHCYLNYCVFENIEMSLW
jgi:hypothetical protein